MLPILSLLKAVTLRHLLYIGGAVVLAYTHQLTYNTGVDRTTLKYQKEVAKLEAQLQTKTKVLENKSTSLTMGLANSLINISSEREKHHEATNLKLDQLLDKYTHDTAPHGMQYHTQASYSTPPPRLSTPSFTPLVKGTDEWGFSATDRRLILQEAARADKLAEELKQCKVFVNEIYKGHDVYRQAVDDYLYNGK